MQNIEITYIDQDGEAHKLMADNGATLMEVATANNIKGIDGDCGGAAACGTCRITIDEASVAKVPAPDDIETDLLDFVAEGEPGQRLGCQITVTPELESACFAVAT